MIAWIVAALLAGKIMGAALGAWAMYRLLKGSSVLLAGSTLLPAPAPPPQPQPARVHTPVDPEELAARLLSDSTKARMRDDFMQTFNLSEEKANEAVDEMNRKLRFMGAEGW